MKFSTLAIAALPALALAQDSAATETSLATLTKTVRLSTAPSAGPTLHHNSTTVAASASGPFHRPTGTGASGGFGPTLVPTAASPSHTKGPDSAGSALDSSKVVLSGVAGMLMVAML